MARRVEVLTGICQFRGGGGCGGVGGGVRSWGSCRSVGKDGHIPSLLVAACGRVVPRCSDVFRRWEVSLNYRPK